MGLIGASLGLNLRGNGHTIVGAVRSARSLDLLRQNGFTDVTTDEVIALQMLHSCDVLVLGVNVDDCYRLLDLVLQNEQLKNRLIIFDMCSTKAEICAYVNHHYPTANFVGTHPMAGKEKQGPEAAEATLFTGSTVFITSKSANDVATTQVEELWMQTGARTARIEAATHDRTMAYVSHGLHLAACVIAELSGEAFDSALTVSPVAGSYRDMTRIALSSGDMWQSITSSNRENIADWLQKFGAHCTQLGADIRAEKEDIRKLFDEAGQIRQKFMRT